MTHRSTKALLMGATALWLPLAGAANAQDNAAACDDLRQMVQNAENAELAEPFRDAEDVAEAGEVERCVVYIEEIRTAGGITTAETQRQNGQETEQASDTETDSATETETDMVRETETFQESEEVTETVEIQKQAVVDGEVVVQVPNPEVQVDQPGAEVNIRESQASVDIEQQPAEILVRQPQANISVNMPQPTITIEQPAPEIIITMPEPGVSVAKSEPQVEVVQADPKVSVTQGDPNMDVQVEARLVDPGEAEGEVATRTERTNADGETVETAEPEVALNKSEPTVTIERSADAPEYTFNRAEPSIRYEPSEPNIEFAMDGEPTVEITQVGEPKVTIRGSDAEGDQMDRADAGQATDDQPDGTQQQLAEGEQTEPRAEEQTLAEGEQPVGQETQAADGGTALQPTEDGAETEAAETAGQPAEGEQMQADATQETPAGADDAQTEMAEGEQDMTEPVDTAANTDDMMSVVVNELNGADVITANGEEMGDVDRVVTLDGTTYIVVEHGGFLGLGDSEVALEAERVAFNGEEVILQDITDEELENMPEFDMTNEQRLASDRTLEMHKVRQ